MYLNLIMKQAYANNVLTYASALTVTITVTFEVISFLFGVHH